MNRMASDWNDSMLSEPQELAAGIQIPNTTTDGADLSSFPAEIYESIIDQLADSPNALRRCALVCRLFAQRAQMLFFSYISLERPTKPTRSRSHLWPSMRFLQLLSTSSHLAGYVKSLKISDEDPLQVYREELSWICKDQAVPQILPLLVNVEKLQLSGTPRGSSLDVRTWGDNLYMGIMERCASEGLVALNLLRVRNIPLSVLGLAPRLQTLELTQVFFAPEFNDRASVGESSTPEEQKKSHPPARLEFLSVASTCHEWRTFYHHVHLDLAHIKDLTFQIEFEDVTEEEAKEGLQAISELLCGCSATLKKLWFLIPDEYSTSDLSLHQFFRLDGHTMPALRELKISARIWNEDQYEILAGGMDPTFSETGPPRTVLRTLTSILSQTLPSESLFGEHDGGSSSGPNLGPSHGQLEILILTLIVDDFKVTSAKFRLLGWGGFARVLRALSEVGKTSLELKQEARRRLRGILEWETGWEPTRPKKRLAPRPGTTAVEVLILIPSPILSLDTMGDFLAVELGWLSKGVRLRAHFT